MGQSSSTPSQTTQRSSAQSWPRLHISASAGDSPSMPSETDDDSRTVPALNPSVSTLRRSQPFATVVRQVSARSTPVNFINTTHRNEIISAQDDVLLEEHERRLLVPAEEDHAESAPVTYITASPMPTRSPLSRFRRRLFSGRRNNRPTDDGLRTRGEPLRRGDSLVAGSEQAAQGDRVYAHRRRASTSAMARLGELAHGSRRRRVPVPSNDLTTFARRQSSSMAPNDSPAEQRSVSSASRHAHQITYAQSDFAHSLIARFHRRRWSRNSQVDLAHQAGNRANTWGSDPLATDSNRDASLQVPSLMESTGNATLPDQTVLDTSSTDESQREPHALSDDHRSTHSQNGGLSGHNRLNAAGSSSRRDDPRSVSLPRRSRSRLARRTDDLSSSTILRIAAGGLAAQVSGSSLDSPVPMQALRPRNQDATFHDISQLLQSADQRPRRGENYLGMDRASSFASMRTFRFVSTSTGSRSRVSTSPGDGITPHELAVPLRDANDDLRITIVLLAIHPSPSEDVVGEGIDERNRSRVPPNSLFGTPTSALPSIQAGDHAGDQSQESVRRSHFHLLRRASFGGRQGGGHDLSSDFDLHMQQRRSSTGITDRSDMSLRPRSHNLSGSFDPAPPPSTPAELAISAASSHMTARPRAASAVSSFTRPAALAEADSDRATSPEENSIVETRPSRSMRQRRQSDSSFARHRNLGAGAARRNGVVEPDDIDTTTPPANRSRNWLVYVVGPDLPQDHPMWSAPGLYDNDPSYEDLVMLSSLLGPAKLSVADADDVAFSGGIFHVESTAQTLLAKSADCGGQFAITPGERCLVCLEQYRAGDELRQLSKCVHAFHMECIDEWLTTGRNSCPLCRRRGVNNGRERLRSG